MGTTLAVTENCWYPTSGAQVRISLLRGFDSVPRNGRGERTMAGTRLTIFLIRHVLLDTSQTRYFRREEIDAAFRDKVLKCCSNGIHYARGQGFKDKLRTLQSWTDLIINALTITFSTFHIIKTGLHGGLNSKYIEETAAAAQTWLERLKIIEDWISSNPEFMLEVLAHATKVPV